VDDLISFETFMRARVKRFTTEELRERVASNPQCECPKLVRRIQRRGILIEQLFKWEFGDKTR
jgi:hypothetical protein